jgi:hypothetical protein
MLSMVFLKGNPLISKGAAIKEIMRTILGVDLLVMSDAICAGQFTRLRSGVKPRNRLDSGGAEEVLHICSQSMTVSG